MNIQPMPLVTTDFISFFIQAQGKIIIQMNFGWILIYWPAKKRSGGTGRMAEDHLTPRLLQSQPLNFLYEAREYRINDIKKISARILIFLTLTNYKWPKKLMFLVIKSPLSP